MHIVLRLSLEDALLTALLGLNPPKHCSTGLTLLQLQGH
jgi:hypothetical protein